MPNEEGMVGGGGGEQLQGGKVVKTLDSRARCPSLNHFFLSKENKEYTTRQHKDYSRELWINLSNPIPISLKPISKLGALRCWSHTFISLLRKIFDAESSEYYVVAHPQAWKKCQIFRSRQRTLENILGRISCTFNGRFRGNTSSKLVDGKTYVIPLSTRFLFALCFNDFN